MTANSTMLGMATPLRSCFNATLEAVGRTAVWLASDYGAFTTGEVVHVDGGYHVLGMPQQENLSSAADKG
jgi:enoyl-[acyl-carrier protein] reductase I